MAHDELLTSLHDTFATLAQRRTKPWLQSTADVERVVETVELCFMSGMYTESKWDEPNDLWSLFGALHWLNPDSIKPISTGALDTVAAAAAAAFVLRSYGRADVCPHVICPNERIRNDRGLRWLYEQIATKQRLSGHLRHLMHNEALIGSLYKANAFVCDEKRLNALVQCLRALESEQSALFDTIVWPVDGDRGEDVHKSEAVSLAKRSLANRCFFGSGSLLVNREEALPLLSSRLSRANSLPLLRKTTRSFATKRTARTLPKPCRLPAKRPTTTTTVVDAPEPDQLQPIELVKCDDIKIHFDRKHAARVSAAHDPTAGPSAAAAAIPIDRPAVPQSLLYTLLPMLSKSPPPTGASPTPTENKYMSAEGSVSPSLYAQFMAASAPSELVNAFIPRVGEKLYDRRSQSSLSTAYGACGPRDQFELYAPDECFVAGAMDGELDVPLAMPSASASAGAASAGAAGGRGIASSSRSSSSNNSSSAGSCCSTGSGFAQPPSAEHSLTQFLQSAQFSCANSDLERENAHFSVSEAMIWAIEQMKCRKLFQAQSDELEKLRLEDEQNSCRQQSQQMEPAGPRRSVSATPDTNDKYRRAVMSGSSPSSSAASFSSSLLLQHKPPALQSPQSYPSTSASSASYEPGHDVHRSRASRPIHCKPNPHVATRRDAASTPHSPPSTDRNPAEPTTTTTAPDTSADECRAYAEWGATRADTWSAESVALSLIAKFSDQQLPRAADLLWLVSEQDAPQKLLPLPGSWTVNPDEPYKIPFMRGTRDWAPPRAQVIFTRHEKFSRKELLQRQNYRCAGCGMRVAAAYSNRFRYCEYLGRYHCTNCHRNQIAVIPAHVLHDWDFTHRPVSVFAYRLLEQIACVPVFRVAQLNVALYGRIRALQLARQNRGQLRFVRDFVVACRFAAADGTKQIFEQVAAHIVDDLEAWSMSDFQAVRAGTFGKDIGAVLARCEQHIGACELCTARGFVCERCTKKQVIFPWQPKVRRCPACGVCVHAGCWKATEECSRCERLRVRRAQQLQRSHSTVSLRVVAQAGTTTTTTTAAADGSAVATRSSTRLNF